MRFAVLGGVSIGLLVAGCDGDDVCLHSAGASGRCLGNDAKIWLDARPTCNRMPAAADRARFVVIAHPYDSAGNASAVFEVLQLSQSGTLTRFVPTKTFALGKRAPFGVMAFTPDGQIGLVALDDGTVGEFSLDAEGNPTVLDLGFGYANGFYADRIVMDPSGDYAWIVDSNTRANGGGIYRVTIGCDGKFADAGLEAPGSSPGGFAFDNAGHAVIAARDILDSPTSGDDVHLIQWGPLGPTARLSGGDAFGDDDVIFSGFALSHDAGTAFVGDSNVTGTNRVGIVTVNPSSPIGIAPLAVISGITDPSGIAASPFGDVAVVTSSQPPGEGIYLLDKGGTGSTWRKRGAVTYAGAAPQLPGDVVTIDQGALTGTVLVSELSNVRRLLFHSDGSVTDEGSLALGSGLENVAGAIGVTP